MQGVATLHNTTLGSASWALRSAAAFACFDRGRPLTVRRIVPETTAVAIGGMPGAWPPGTGQHIAVIPCMGAMGAIVRD